MLRIVLPAAILVVCVGCASLPGFERSAVQVQTGTKVQTGGIGVYFKDRALDFADVFCLSLSMGIGVLANARVTQAVQAGGIFFGGARFGLMGRQAGAWSEEVFEMGFPGFYGRSAQIIPGGGSIKAVGTERGQSLWIFCGDEGVPYDKGYDRKFWQVGATVHAGIIGVDFSINLQELLDFLLGWTTVDICRDDTASRAAESAKE